MASVTKSAVKKAARVTAVKADSFDPRVDAQVAKAPAFARPILEYWRELVHVAVPDVVEEVKWSRPFFTVQGQNLCYMAAFKQHCAFGFWFDSMRAVLQADGIDGSGSAGSFGRIASVDDLPSRTKLLGYMRKGAEMIRQGTAGAGPMDSERPEKKPAAEMPGEFAAALQKSGAASRNFAAFPPSCKREYVEWIASAKKEETRERRIAQAITMIAANTRMNDKYRKPAASV